MTMFELNNILVKYIEDNKYKNGIGYEFSIGELKELLKEIEKGYEEEGLI